MYNASGMYVFQATLEKQLVSLLICHAERTIAYQDLVQEVLDELLLQWPRSEQTVKIGTKQLRHEVAIVHGKYRVARIRVQEHTYPLMVR